MTIAVVKMLSVGNRRGEASGGLDLSGSAVVSFESATAVAIDSVAAMQRVQEEAGVEVFR